MRVVGGLEADGPALVEAVVRPAARSASSVRSGRKEKVPWVMRMAGSSFRRRRRGDEVGRVGRRVVEGDRRPRCRARLRSGGSAWPRRAGCPGPRATIVAALVAGQDHGFERDAVGGGAGRDAHAGGRWCRRRTAAPRPRRERSSNWCIWPAWMPPEATGMTLAQSRPSPGRSRCRAAGRPGYACRGRRS